MTTKKVSEVLAAILVCAWFIAASVAAADAMTARFGQVEQTEQTDRPDRPAIFVLGVKLFQEYDGVDALLLTYSMSGAVQAVSFRDPAELDEYLVFLSGFGPVRYAGDTVPQSGADL